MKKFFGQIFLMTLLVLSTVLTAGIILITIFTRDLKLSTETTTSVQALYVADSVVEARLYNKFHGSFPALNFLFAPKVDYKFCEIPGTEYYCPFSCEAGTECIKAVGIIGSVSRGLEVDFKD